MLQDKFILRFNIDGVEIVEDVFRRFRLWVLDTEMISEVLGEIDIPAMNRQAMIRGTKHATVYMPEIQQ